MKLSDFTEDAPGKPAGDALGGVSTGDLLRLKESLREELYQRISSERLAQLASLERKRAKDELSVLVRQVAAAAGLDCGDTDAQAALVEATVDMIVGLGPIEALLEDDSVTEIMVNGAGNVFCEREGKLERASGRFDSEGQLRQVVDRIVSPLGRRVDDAQPLVNARLPQGHRVNAVIPPVSVEGTLLTIRKFKSKSYSLAELVDLGGMSEPIAKLLAWCVIARKNIAVCGGTGGGKTTLLNALSAQIPHDERVVTIEDAAELKFDVHPHVVRMEARMANAEGTGEVSIRDLVVNALRMRPDRIIVGECRSAEALDMLQAMTTGHDGSLTTLHAGSPREAMARLVTMVRYGMDLPVPVIEEQVASALDVIVQQDRVLGGARKVTQVVSRRRDFYEDDSRFPYEVVVRWDKSCRGYVWERPPDWMDELVLDGYATRDEVDRWMQQVF